MSDTPQHAIHFFRSDPCAEPLWVLLPDDGTRGYVMGKKWEVEQLRDALTGLLENGEHEGEIGSRHEQLGFKWHTSHSAMRMMLVDFSINIPHSSITHACRQGHIANAVKEGRDWRFPQMNFLHWVKNRPKPGRKPE